MPKIISFLGYDPRPKPATLSEQLTWYREGKGWTQEEFATRLGIDASTLSRWELGKRKPLRRCLASLQKMPQK